MVIKLQCLILSNERILMFITVQSHWPQETRDPRSLSNEKVRFVKVRRTGVQVRDCEAKPPRTRQAQR